MGTLLASMIGALAMRNPGLTPMGWNAALQEDRVRMIVDDRGVEWEVYDEGSWTIGLALEWDHLPQLDNPGLIFVSNLDRRRLWPRPADWRSLTDKQLLSLLLRARSI